MQEEKDEKLKGKRELSSLRSDVSPEKRRELENVIKRKTHLRRIERLLGDEKVKTLLEAGDVFNNRLENDSVELRPAMSDALEFAEYIMVGDNVGDSGNDKNSLVLHQWYPLGGLKDSHADKLHGGAVRLKVKIVLKDVLKGGALKEFVPYNDMDTILRKVSSNFKKMKLELSKFSIERDEELHKIRILEMNSDIRKRNERRKARNFVGDDVEMYGEAMEHEVLSSYELGRESRKKQLQRQIIELEKQISHANEVKKRMEDIVELDQIFIPKTLTDRKVWQEAIQKFGISAGKVSLNAAGQTQETFRNLSISASKMLNNLGNNSNNNDDSIGAVKKDDSKNPGSSDDGLFSWVSKVFSVSNSMIEDNSASTREGKQDTHGDDETKNG